MPYGDHGSADAWLPSRASIVHSSSAPISGIEAAVGRGLFGAREQCAYAEWRRVALLVVQVARRPGHAVVDVAQIRGIDPDSQIADDADAGCERDAAVDAEDTPRR